MKQKENLSEGVLKSIEARQNQELESDPNEINAPVFQWLTDEQLKKVDYSRWKYSDFQEVFGKKKIYCDEKGRFMTSSDWDKNKLAPVVGESACAQGIGQMKKGDYGPEIKDVFGLIPGEVISGLNIDLFDAGNVALFFEIQKKNITKEQFRVFYKRRGEIEGGTVVYDWFAQNKPEFFKDLEISEKDKSKLKQTNSDVFAYSSKAQKAYSEQNK